MIDALAHRQRGLANDALPQPTYFQATPCCKKNSGPSLFVNAGPRDHSTHAILRARLAQASPLHSGCAGARWARLVQASPLHLWARLAQASPPHSSRARLAQASPLHSSL